MKKVIVFGVIVLFVGVGFQPAFAIEPKLSDDNTQVEEDCGCKEVSDIDLYRLDKTINRIENYTKLLSLYSKRNTEYEEISEEISKKVTALQGRLQELKDYPLRIFYCSLLLMLFLLYWGIFEFLFDIYSNLPNQDSIFAHIIGNLMILIFLDAYSWFLIADAVPCEWTEIINPFPIEKNSLNNPLNPIIN